MGVEGADLGIERLGRQMPGLLYIGPVLGIGHQAVGRQTVRESAHLARRAAGRGLPGEREGAVARLGILAQQQMVHVHLLVDPGAALVLVEAHGPEGQHLALGIDVVVGELPEFGLEAVERLVRVALGQLGDEVQGVGFHRALEVVEADQPVAGRVGGVFLLDHLALLAALGDGLVFVEFDPELLGLGVLLRREGVFVGRPHAIADVVRASGKDAVLVDEVPVHRIAGDDLAGDVVLDGEIRVRLDDDLQVGDVGGHVAEGGDVDHPGLLVPQTAVGDARP